MARRERERELGEAAFLSLGLFLSFASQLQQFSNESVSALKKATNKP